MPALDWQEIKDSLKPLLLYPRLGVLDLMRNAAGWLVFAVLFETVAGSRFDPRRLLAVVAFIFASEILIVRNSLSAGNVAGAALALGIWWCARTRHLETRAAAIWLALTVVLMGLEPFRLEPSSSFHFLPFHGFLTGSMFWNSSQLFLKLYFYGALLWLATGCGLRLRTATVVIATALFGMELLQPMLPGRTAEVTDPILVSLAAGMMRALPSEHDLIS